MRKFLSIFFIASIICLAGLVPAGSASAHVLKVDGSIGATLHVDPEDNPVAGESATFYFVIKDKQNKFAPENCDCQVDIKTTAGESVKTEKLFTASSSAGLITPLLQFVFPKGGVYKVALMGSPKTQGAFQAFSLAYDVRVENGAASSSADNTHGADQSHTKHGTFLIIITLLAALVVAVLARRQKGKSAAKGSGHTFLHSLLALLVIGSSFFLYTTRLTAVFEPAAIHRHIEGESGHAQRISPAGLPQIAASVSPVSCIVSIQQLQRLAPLVALEEYLPQGSTIDDRAPPKMIA